jgi:hypothetical protein
MEQMHKCNAVYGGYFGKEHVDVNNYVNHSAVHTLLLLVLKCLHKKCGIGERQPASLY